MICELQKSGAQKVWVGCEKSTFRKIDQIKRGRGQIWVEFDEENGGDVENVVRKADFAAVKVLPARVQRSKTVASNSASKAVQAEKLVHKSCQESGENGQVKRCRDRRKRCKKRTSKMLSN